MKLSGWHLKCVRPIQKVIDLDRRQKEYSVTLSKYLRNSISEKRIKNGKSMFNKYRTILKNTRKKLWCAASNFDCFMGNGK